MGNRSALVEVNEGKDFVLVFSVWSIVDMYSVLPKPLNWMF